MEGVSTVFEKPARNSETIKKLYQDLRLAEQPYKLNPSEITHVTQIVDELLDNQMASEGVYAEEPVQETLVSVNGSNNGRLASNILLLVQIAMILLFGVFVSYEPGAKPQNYDNGTIQQYYPSTQACLFDLAFSLKSPHIMGSEHWKSSVLIVTVELVILILYVLFTAYDPSADGSSHKHSLNPTYGGSPHTDNPVIRFDSLFQDVHVMIFIGFGFLMTFLKKYGYSAVGYNMLVAAIAIQWSVLCRGLFQQRSIISIDITSLINGDFAAAAVLITFGALLGVTSPTQLVAISLIEVFLYALNEFIGTEILKAIDVGGSMYIHTFGAYFGLSLSLVLRKASDCASTKEGASYNSDIFAMIGTVFLWMFWPSFNGAMATGDDQHRAVINTVFSLTASCISTFAISAIVNKDKKFSMVHVQNATLAGGVAVGAVADLMIRPYGALIIGSVAGILSTLGYAYVTPFLQSKLNLHDTCGVNNLHGMPGIMAGLAGVVMAAIASENDYGIGLYTQYPAMSPETNTSALSELRKDLSSIEPGDGRTSTQQALYQLMALGVTLAIAIVGGATTGLLMRLPIFGQTPEVHLFDDSKLWEVPENEPIQDNTQTNASFEMKPEK